MSYPDRSDKNKIVEYFCKIFTNFVLSKKFECHVCIYNVLGYKYSQKKSRCIILSLYRRYTPSIIVSCDTAWFDSHIYFWALHYFASLGVQDPVWCQAAITTTYQARHGLWYIANIMIVNIAWGGWQNNRHAGREGFHYGTFGVIFDRHLRGSKYQPDRAKSRGRCWTPTSRNPDHSSLVTGLETWPTWLTCTNIFNLQFCLFSGQEMYNYDKGSWK